MHSEVNLIIQYIIVQDQDGQKNNINLLVIIFKYKLETMYYKQGPDFHDMSSFFPCEIDDAIPYIILWYGVQAPKIVIL